jgi:hypothetical protein
VKAVAMAVGRTLILCEVGEKDELSMRCRLQMGATAGSSSSAVIAFTLQPEIINEDGFECPKIAPSPLES